MKFAYVADHLKRVLHHAGKPLRLGSARYRLRGYFANVMAHDLNSEPFMRTVLQRVLASRPGAFIDVGANAGQTFISLLCTDPGRIYIGFEPQVECCFLIDRFIKDNHLSHARVLPLALSDHNSLLQLYSSKPLDPQASLIEGAQPDGIVRDVETTVVARVLDEVLDELGVGEVAAIKIDVEGAELQVLRGLSRTLARRRPVVIFEVLPNFLIHNGVKLEPAIRAAKSATAASIHQLLTGAGYQIFAIEDSTGRESRMAGFDLDDRSTFLGCNFIAYPIEARVQGPRLALGNSAGDSQRTM